MCRDFQKCLTECEKPHKIQSTARGGSDGIMVKAGKKDIVTAIFILLHENEKTGWIERNAKREFFAHADTLLASESSLKKAIKILLDAIPDARRIGTTLAKTLQGHIALGRESTSTEYVRVLRTRFGGSA